jgi:dTDP-4-amino-4,6-dideoxygalactose transaminase
MKQKLDRLKNFGYESELHIGLLGTNAKMNEVQAAFGLESLKIVDDAIKERKEITNVYRDSLQSVPGIKVMQDVPGVKHNYSYFPIFVDEQVYGLTRDALYENLMAENIYSRRYFSPLITDFELYKDNPKVRVTDLHTAETTTRRVICLPLHHEVSVSQVKQIVELIAGWAKRN